MGRRRRSKSMCKADPTRFPPKRKDYAPEPIAFAGKCSLPTGTSRAARFLSPSLSLDLSRGPPPANLRLPLRASPWGYTDVSVVNRRRCHFFGLSASKCRERLRKNQNLLPELALPLHAGSAGHPNLLSCNKLFDPDGVCADCPRRDNGREFRSGGSAWHRGFAGDSSPSFSPHPWRRCP